MWQIIRDLAGNGVTIFLTTQYLEEADQLAHRIAVLDQGRLVAQGSAIELKRRIPGGHIRLRFTVAGAAQGTAISIATDVHAGIIARFRTMAIARSAVLTGRAWRPRAASQCSYYCRLPWAADSSPPTRCRRRSSGKHSRPR